MSDLLIKGMEMPKEPDEMIEVAIFGDGKVVQTGESWRSPDDGKCYYTTTNPEKFFQAVSVPPHGRLIDADALCEGRARNDNVVICAKCASTIIEAEEEICTKN